MQWPSHLIYGCSEWRMKLSHLWGYPNLLSIAAGCSYANHYDSWCQYLGMLCSADSHAGEEGVGEVNSLFKCKMAQATPSQAVVP